MKQLFGFIVISVCFHWCVRLAVRDELRRAGLLPGKDGE